MDIAQHPTHPMATGHRAIAPSILYFGTPVALLTTENADGTDNLAPVSSLWALGQIVVIGLGGDGQTAHNLRARSDLVISLPSPDMWERVEALAPLTGRFPVPPGKPAGCRHEPDKFGAAGLTPQRSELVRPSRVAGCPLQFEARAARVREGVADWYVTVEAEVLRVHADPAVVVPGTQHVDPAAWSPLIYNFRHYFGLGPELGHSYRTDTPRPA
ncbi:flavin reductase family protein [Streptomyces sp. NPDC050703]|uniref:flavin reductase family protein n=1 Tax=Streptomyces sp. NPDC050703 TaxID=3157218 RepID=UPI003422DE0A